MYNSDTELLFPLRVIPTLESARGETWRDLIKRLSAPEADVVDRLAFVMLMVKYGGCMACTIDSFRAMRGCTQCARQTVRRLRGSDQEIIEQFLHMRADVEAMMRKQAADPA